MEQVFGSVDVDGKQSARMVTEGASEAKRPCGPDAGESSGEVVGIGICGIFSWLWIVWIVC